MKPGPELDALVSEKIFGVKLYRVDRVCINGKWQKGETWLRHGEAPEGPMAGSWCGMKPAPYSTDIAAAWEVVERLSDRFHARINSPFTPGDPYTCGFTPIGVTGWNGRPDFLESAETAPHAICLAALAAVGVEVGGAAQPPEEERR